MLTGKTSQERVAEFIDRYSLEAPVDARLLDLTSESGELAREYLKETSYGQKEFHPAPEWVQEIGDVYFALLCVAIKSDVNLEQALEDALERYEARVHEHGDAGNPRAREQ